MSAITRREASWRRPGPSASAPAALCALVLAALLAPQARAQLPAPIRETTKQGALVIQPIKHASVMLTFRGKHYYIDPSALPPGVSYPKADAILITHEHFDHADPQAIRALSKPGTVVVANPATADKLGLGQPMKNGQKRKVLDATVEAVPAYNVVRTQFHPKGRDNGYVLTLGGKRIYFAGDTEPIPEMKGLKAIDVAFLPINLPYTMPPKDAAAAARSFHPKLVVPYHQGESNPQEVADALRGSGVQVRVLKLP